MPQALEGIKVIDIAQHMAGPGVSMYLADHGAEVIKVEPRAGDNSRKLGTTPRLKENSRVFMGLNRNKLGMTLDVRTPEGKEVVRRLVERSDVLIHNYRPATAQKLGLGYETLSQINPRIIVASLTAFGTKGPYAHKPGYDRMTQGMSGAMYRKDANGVPMTTGIWMSDCSVPIILAYGVMLALWTRERTGRGQQVETSLLHAALAMQSYDMIYVDNEPDPLREYGGPGYGVFQCSDGVFINVGALLHQQFGRLCRALDLDHLADDPRFADPAQAAQFRAEAWPIIEEMFADKTSKEWIAILDEVDVPCAPILSREEVFSEPQVVENDMVVPMEHPAAGSIRILGVPVKLSETPGSVRTPAPLLGQHTDHVLSLLGYSAPEIQQLRAQEVV